MFQKPVKSPTIICKTFSDRAGPRITLFHSMSLHHNADEGKMMDFQQGPLSVCSLHVLPMSVRIFPGDSEFLPHHKDVHVGVIGVSKLSQCG